MLRPAPLALSVLLAAGALAGCAFEGRTDGGSPLHTDNGALEAHRDAVESVDRRMVVEPLSGAPTATATPVPTPQLDTASEGPAPAPAGAMASPAAPTTEPAVPATAPAQ